MFAVTPWVPKLVLVLILYLILNKYFAVLMLGGLAYWYLRKEPKKADAADASGDEAKGAGGVDAADATASALAATDKGRKSSDKKNIKSKDQKAAADKKDD